MRGGLIGVNQLAINCGIILVFALGLPTLGLSWRALAAAALVPLAALAAGALLVPESPRWLAAAGRTADAAAALRTLRRRADVSHELRTIQAGLAAAADEPAPHLMDFVGRPALARPLRLVLAYMLLQQATGINCVFFNIAPIFAAAGLENADAAALAVLAPQLLISLAACFSMDAAGRRPLLLWASAIMALAAAALGLSFSLPASMGAVAHPLALGSCFIFVSAFSVGMGPIPWILMGELFPPRVRGVAASAATAVSNLAAFGVTVSFGGTVRILGMANAFYLYAFASAVTWAFTFTNLPETKGRSLERIGSLLIADVPPWEEGPPPPPDEEDGAGEGEAAVPGDGAKEK
jgi:SP family facilitated glucose transporter-like MFS transporter 8